MDSGKASPWILKILIVENGGRDGTSGGIRREKLHLKSLFRDHCWRGCKIGSVVHVEAGHLYMAW